MLTTQDEEFAKILEDLDCGKITTANANLSDYSRLSGYFCLDTVFNLSKRVLSETEIKILEKGLDYAPAQRKINETELKSDFEEFCKIMRINGILEMNFLKIFVRYHHFGQSHLG